MAGTASKGARFKALLHAPEILIMPGVYDGYTARLAEASGFKAASISGAGVSESRLGWVDRGIMGFDENLANARRLADCTDDLLLRVDADTGHGNALTLHFVVRAFEKAGMANMMFEDQVWPKRCGHMKGKACIEAVAPVRPGGRRNRPQPRLVNEQRETEVSLRNLLSLGSLTLARVQELRS